MDLYGTIRTIPDFPKKGIQFKDITTLLRDQKAFRFCVDSIAERFHGRSIDTVVGIESRGFIVGAALAYRLGAGFVPIRKPGKLPAATLRQEYQLEYGTDAMEIHSDAILPNANVLIHDDVLATGGTMAAACSLVQRLQGSIVGISVLVELSFLNGRKKLDGFPIHSLLDYPSET